MKRLLMNRLLMALVSYLLMVGCVYALFQLIQSERTRKYEEDRRPVFTKGDCIRFTGTGRLESWESVGGSNIIQMILQVGHEKYLTSAWFVGDRTNLVPISDISFGDQIYYKKVNCETGE